MIPAERGTGFSGSQGDRVLPDRRDAEIARLRTERDKLRAQLRTAHSEAEEAQRRLSLLAAASKKFASSMRGGADARRRSRRSLTTQYALSRVLAEAKSLPEAAPRILEILGAGLRWRQTVLWAVDEAAGVLRCEGAWRSPVAPPDGFEDASRRTRLPRGACLPGRVWDLREPVWVEDLRKDEGFLRKEAAEEEGLRGALAFPIRDGGVIGVLELFCYEPAPPDEDQISTAVLIGNQIGQFVQRRRAEEEREELRREAEAARREVSGTLESIGDAFFALDGERRFTYVNREAERFLGAGRAELLGRRIWEAFPETTGSGLHGAVEEASEGGGATGFEEISPLTGAWISTRVYPRVHPLIYPRQNGVSVFFQDITERKRAEEALRENEERLSAIFSQAAAGLSEISLDGRFVRVNEGLCEMLGRPREELLASDVPEVTHPEDVANTLAVFGRVVETGERVSLDKRYLRPDGTVVWANSALTRLDDERGRPRAVLAVTVDLTERKRAEESLRESEERYRSLAEATSSIVWTAARDGACVKEMPAWEEFTGQTFEQYRGFDWLDAVHPEDRPPENAWEGLAEIPMMMEAEYRLRRRDGEYRRVASRSVPILGGDGEVREWVGTITDIEDRCRAEEEREELRRVAEAERARLEAVLQQMPGGVFIADRSGRITLANEGATRMYGKQMRSVEECEEHALSYPDGREIPPEGYPLARALGGESVSGMEYYVLRDNGTRGVVVANSAPVRDGEGRIVAAVKAFQDVTPQKEAEERLRTVVGSTPVVLFAMDREGVFTLSEGQGLGTLGLAPGEVVGRSIFELFADEPEALAATRRALDGEAFFEFVTLRDRVFETWYSPLRDEGGAVSSVTGVATDVTERRRAEEERERSLARERASRDEAEAALERLAFLAGAAEERRRISRELHDRVAHAMGVVHQSLELHGAFREKKPALAEDKLLLARGLAKEALDSTRDLSMALRDSEVEEGLGPALSKLVGTTVPPDVRYAVSVEGDESLVPQRVRDQVFLVLREAVRNAAAHSGCASIAVELDVAPERVAGSVEDDGEGFDPEEADNNGTGGLRSMRERAGMVGGTCGLASGPDRGTRVEVVVPLRETSPEETR